MCRGPHGHAKQKGECSTATHFGVWTAFARPPFHPTAQRGHLTTATHIPALRLPPTGTGAIMPGPLATRLATFWFSTCRASIPLRLLRHLHRRASPPDPHAGGGIDDALRDIGDSRMGIEGYQASKWVVQDYGDVLVHVFDPETRAPTRWKNCGRMTCMDWERGKERAL